MRYVFPRSPNHHNHEEKLLVMSNANPKLIDYLDRLIALEQEKRDLMETIKSISVEMKSKGHVRVDVDAVKKVVREHFMAEEKRAHKEAVEEVANSIALIRDVRKHAAAIGAGSLNTVTAPNH